MIIFKWHNLVKGWIVPRLKFFPLFRENSNSTECCGNMFSLLVSTENNDKSGKEFCLSSKLIRSSCFLINSNCSVTTFGPAATSEPFFGEISKIFWTYLFSVNCFNPKDPPTTSRRNGSDNCTDLFWKKPISRFGVDISLNCRLPDCYVI